jgi:hypothetical protein
MADLLAASPLTVRSTVCADMPRAFPSVRPTMRGVAIA